MQPFFIYLTYMKIYAITSILIILFSCKNQNKQLILGKWKPIHQHKKEDDYLYNWTITFDKDSTATLTGSMSKSNPVIYQINNDSIYMYSITQAFSVNAKIKFSSDYIILSRKEAIDTLEKIK